MNTSALPYFKSSFQYGGMLGKRELEQIYGMLKNITGEGGVTVTSDFGRGIKIKSVAVNTTKKSFTVSISGYNATILAGTIRTAWGNFAVSAVTSARPLVLTGSTAWIYVQAVKASMSATIQFSNSEPINTGSNWQWPLVKATSSDGGISYAIADGDIRHDGDFYFFSPINKP